MSEARSRLLIIAVGTAVMAAGVTLAVLPLDHTIDLGRGEIAKANCRRPLVAAWSSTRKGQLGLRGTTYGTEASGYEVRDGAEPYCAVPARVRVAGAAVLVIVGISTTLGGVR